ncbi:sugar phosphate isomerase/epimerase family protein [Spirosoma sordidisoli]|uniref:Sugar phosphate isomerase/epimerase n=1 Tax=Spirosoma sordidisoli TaxID=2502893 RepID=A0A4Q2UG61_9BACT|nr:sugar phosphate isomerase/epimerase family protein [Spirosoma sordidisoli]RYC68297.1 sugar phosphate isomerase/epimerase [Spirosoma sordidisoli]
MNRRDALRYSLGLGVAALACPALATTSRFNIGACDWSIGSAGAIDAFAVARQIGLDGVQVSLNTVADHDHLRKPEVLQAYKEAARQAGVGFGGLAIGLLNTIPYKSDPRTDAWVQDSIDVARALGVKNVLLAFFSNNDLRNDKKGQQVVIDKLKAVAPKAEKAGVTLGIESWLSAPDHRALIDAVGSPAVKVYYDVCNATVEGYDIFREMRELGTDLICEVHLKENGFLLGKGKIDLVKVRQTLDEIGYTGWLQIEGAIPKGQPILASYIENNRTVRILFG